MIYNADFSPKSEEMKVMYMVGPGFDNYLNCLRDPSGPVWTEMKRTILDFRPAVVGISAQSPTFASTQLVAKLAKEINKRVIVIVGGPHSSAVGSEVLNCPDIDISVSGEGENTIVEILHAIDNRVDLDDIPGVSYRQSGRNVRTRPRQHISDLDSLPFPNRIAREVLKDYDRYPQNAFKYIFATRGCPYSCIFCGSRSVWSRKVRFRSPENVVEEINRLQDKGLRSIHFDDDTFGIRKEYIRDICNALIKGCPRLKWSCELHAGLVDEESISLMKEAGCYLIQLGVETASNEILRQIGKNITFEEALMACRIVKRHGIRLEAFFMVGFPQETEDTMRDTMAAMKKIEADQIVYSIFTPYPGTEAFELCKNMGLIGKDYDPSLYNHQSPANCFCVNMNAERFRALASEIERMVDRKNRLKRVEDVLSLDTIWRIQDEGILRALKKGLKIFLGR